MLLTRRCTKWLELRDLTMELVAVLSAQFYKSKQM